MKCIECGAEAAQDEFGFYDGLVMPAVQMATQYADKYLVDVFACNTDHLKKGLDAAMAELDRLKRGE